MNKHFLTNALVLTAAFMGGELRAQTLYPAAGTAFPILSVGLGARAEGMGESFTAVADDLSALDYNPAGLAQIQNFQLGLIHNNYLAGGFYDSLGSACPLGDWGTLALGFNYLNYGSIDQRDSSGNLLGSYSPYDITVHGAFGFALDKNNSIGLSSQWISENINGTVYSGLLWDAGFLTKPAEHFSIGVNLKNLGVETGGYSLPLELWLGTAYRFSLAREDAHSLLLSLAGDIPFEGAGQINMGFEYALEKSYFLRGGYSQALQDNQPGSLRGLDFGAGVKIGQVQLDYSFSFTGDLGNIQRFSLSLLFPSPFRNSPGTRAGETNSSAFTPNNPDFMPPTNKTSRPVVLKFQVKSTEDLTAQQLFDQAEEKQRMGLKQEALDLYLKAVDKDPNFEMAWISLGKLYFDKSLETYRKVLEMDPKNDKLRDWLSHFKP